MSGSEGIRGEQIRLSAALGSTTPDVIYRDEDHEPDEGVCVYLDGLSAHLHGNPETAEQDREIRDWLRCRQLLGGVRFVMHRLCDGSRPSGRVGGPTRGRPRHTVGAAGRNAG